MAIELAMGFLVFLMMIFYWIEVSYMGFVSATVDYAVAESSRAARSSPTSDYHKIFEGIIQDADFLWSGFLKAEDFTLQTTYFRSPSALLDCNANPEGCSGDKPGNMPLAIYQLSYLYRPVLVSLLFDDIGTFTIRREVIAVQEYERERFNEQF